jgi:hypothetical protein
MKKMILAAGLSLLATAAFAGATLDPSKGTNSKGSDVGQSSSSYKGNGDVIGGNGTYAANNPGSDQTTGPHSRPDAVEGNFAGSNNAGGKGK